MTYTIDIQCPDCTLKTKVRFKKPHVVQPTTVRFKCSGCESELLGQIAMPKKKDKQPPNVFLARAKVISASQLLLDMKKEELEFDSLTEEEKNAAKVHSDGDSNGVREVAKESAG